MFDEYLNPPQSVFSPIPAVVAPRPTDLTGIPSSTFINQDVPSTSTSPTSTETQTPVTFEESSSNVQPANPPFEHLIKWTKNHPLENVIGNPSRPVSTRRQLETDICGVSLMPFSLQSNPRTIKKLC
ncbi:hypothetical protein Tco_0522309 [Tanacetum coccineum]